MAALLPAFLAADAALAAETTSPEDAGKPSQRQVAATDVHAPRHRGSLRPQLRDACSPESEEVAALKRMLDSEALQYVGIACGVARRHDIPEGVFLRLITKESGWNAGASSRRGAVGLAQLMPATARSLGVDPSDPAQNLEGGARYLAEQHTKFGSWPLALAAYNAGPYAVRKYRDIPPYRETRRFVREVFGSG